MCDALNLSSGVERNAQRRFFMFPTERLAGNRVDFPARPTVRKLAGNPAGILFKEDYL